MFPSCFYSKCKESEEPLYACNLSNLPQPSLASNMMPLMNFHLSRAARRPVGWDHIFSHQTLEPLNHVRYEKDRTLGTLILFHSRENTSHFGHTSFSLQILIAAFCQGIMSVMSDQYSNRSPWAP